MWGRIVEWFDGRKTKLSGLATGLVALLMQQGIISKEIGELLMTVGGILVVWFLRSGVKKAAQ